MVVSCLCCLGSISMCMLFILVFLCSVCFSVFSEMWCFLILMMWLVWFSSWKWLLVKVFMWFWVCYQLGVFRCVEVIVRQLLLICYCIFGSGCYGGRLVFQWCQVMLLVLLLLQILVGVMFNYCCICCVVFFGSGLLEENIVCRWLCRLVQLSCLGRCLRWVGVVISIVLVLVSVFIRFLWKNWCGWIRWLVVSGYSIWNSSLQMCWWDIVLCICVLFSCVLNVVCSVFILCVSWFRCLLIVLGWLVLLEVNMYSLQVCLFSVCSLLFSVVFSVVSGWQLVDMLFVKLFICGCSVCSVVGRLLVVRNICLLVCQVLNSVVVKVMVLLKYRVQLWFLVVVKVVCQFSMCWWKQVWLIMFLLYRLMLCCGCVFSSSWFRVIYLIMCVCCFYLLLYQLFICE